MPTQLPTDNIAPKPEQMTTKSSVGSSAVGQPQATVGAGQAVTGQAPGANYGTSTTGVRDQAMEASNKQKMIASGQLDPETLKNAQLTQEKINMFTYGVGAPIFGATDSSDKATDETNKTMEDVTGQLATTQAQLASPDYKYYTDYDKEMRDSRDQARDLYDEVKANIEKDFAIRRTEQDTENRIMTGTQSKALARMGALGRSTSGMSYLQDVERTNQEKINKLLVQKEKLLLEATAAYLEQDWNKLETIMSENKKVVDQYNEVQKWKLEDSFKTQDQIMEQERFGWDKEGRAMKKISDLAESGITLDQFSTAEINKLEQDAGLVPGTFEAIYTFNKDNKDLEYATAEYELLSKIPAGETVQLAGKYYTGLGTKSGNLTQYKVTDKQGNEYVLNIDKNTGKEVSRIPISTSFSGPSSVSPKDAPIIGAKIATKYKRGEWGGQCGEFLHNFLPNYPYGLNTFESKVATVNKNIGTGTDQYPPSVGDVVVQDEPAYYADKEDVPNDSVCKNSGGSWTDQYGNPCIKAGHVSIINSYDQETGMITLTESNYYGTMPEQVTNERTMNVNDPRIAGYWRNNLTPELQNTSKTEIKDDKEDTAMTDYAWELTEQYKKDDIDYEQAHDLFYSKYKDIIDAEAERTGADPRVMVDILLQK